MEPNKETQRAWLTLIRTPGVGAVRLRALVERHGGDVLAALESARRRLPEGLDARAREWLREPDTARLEADLAWLAHPGHRLLCFTDEDYPSLLLESSQPAAALFVVGDVAHLLRPQIAIVGARNASAGGLANARAFATALAEAGFVVTSGLAEGVDAAAHLAALDAGAATVAVMGTGPDRVYPRPHRELAVRIAGSGVVASEFPPGVAARAEHFPRRNRIIAGLSLGTLVIEAGLRSGSLITARLAAEQSREVFALPGSIHHPLARGCHRLIRDGARLVETPAEVIETLTPLAQALGASLAERLAGAPAADASASPSQAIDPDYVRLLEVMGYDPLPLEVLVERTGLSAAALSSMLLMLELDNQVASVAGGRYQRLPAVTAGADNA